MSGPGEADRFSVRISAGIEALGLNPDQFPIAGYAAYLCLLKQWNRAYNLTSIRTPAEMVTHHIQDSLSVLPYLHGDRALDVGTGAGLPGLILAMARPDMRWVLLDSRQKKIRFLNQAILDLRLTNVETVCKRVEEYRPAALFSRVITRAFGSLSKFYVGTRHLIAPDGSLLAMKSGVVSGELEKLQGLKNAPACIKIYSLSHPGLRKTRCLVEIRPSAE